MGSLIKQVCLFLGTLNRLIDLTSFTYLVLLQQEVSLHIRVILFYLTISLRRCQIYVIA